MRRSLSYWSTSGFRVQGSGFRVQDSRYSTAKCKLRNSSFILHPSSFSPTSFRLYPGRDPHCHGHNAAIDGRCGAAVQLSGSKHYRFALDIRGLRTFAFRRRPAANGPQGVTVTMLPPRNPDDGEGYFEYIEGPVMQGHNGPDAISGPFHSRSTAKCWSPIRHHRGRFRRHPHVYHPLHRQAIRGHVFSRWRNDRSSSTIRRGRSGLVHPRPHTISPPVISGARTMA